MPKLLFASTSALERALDGTDETFNRYFFALYHCSPDEKASLNDFRARLRAQYPEKATPVGRHFVLSGEPAYQVVRGYYGALSEATTLPEDFRQYARERAAAIEKLQASSRHAGIDLSEGQLSEDKALDFYVCMALANGQVVDRDAM